MNERGHLYIPRIWLILIVAILVVATVIGVTIFITSDISKRKLVKDNIEQKMDNILNENVEKYSEYDEGIETQELPKVEINEFAEKKSTIDGRTPCFYNPVIPAGFKAINTEQDDTIDEQAKWGEQNAYLYGLVIEDKNKNQFVWIPVENMEIFKTTDWQKNEPKETIDSSKYIEPASEDEEEYHKMYYKVKKYGGFYVGRFETSDVTALKERTSVKNSDEIAIRKNLNTYNYVPFKQTSIDGREIVGATELAKNFAKQNSYKKVVTSVMYGVQWDAMLRFIVSDAHNVNSSTRWGNYSTSELNYTDTYGNLAVKKKGEVRLLKAGTSEETKAKNIYDIAGNLYEWTIETSASKNTRIVRGGCYVVNIAQLAAARYAYGETTANNAIGFRISFYVD